DGDRHSHDRGWQAPQDLSHGELVFRAAAAALREVTMLATQSASNIDAPTEFLEVAEQRYAYRRFGKGAGLPLLCLQHFTGTLDNWDPAVTDPLALGREVILFESAGLGRSSGEVPKSISRMAAHVSAFVDALDLKQVDILGY